MDNVVLGIIIFTLLTTFFVIIFLAVGISDSPTNNQQITFQTGTLLSPCNGNSNSCNQGLSCDGSSYVCRLGTGLLCSDSTDCITGLFCSGRCATGPTGSLNSFCPCNSGYICTPQTNGYNICKGSGGTRCDFDQDCASNFCDGGICSSGFPNAHPCSSNNQCSSLNCSNKFCQEPGIITGNRGAACAGICVGYTGAICNNGLACECINGTGVYGSCVTSTQGILSTCSNLSFCTSDLICINSSSTACNGQSGCFCAFPYNDPNTQVTGSSCINGMSPNNNFCYNNSGLGCDSGSQCINSLCSGSSVLALYQFTDINIQNVLTRFPGAINTSIIRGLSGPTGIIKPYKMFAVSDGPVDTIYLVDHNQGFFSLQYNSITKTVIVPWQLLIPYQNNGRTLIDVGYNGSTFIVAFNQVTGINNNDVVYIGSTPSNLTLFNVQTGSGLPGTQYTVSGTPLRINYIDISPSNDVSVGGDVLISSNGSIYIKPRLQTRYSLGVVQGGSMNGTPMTNVTGPARFYFDNIESGGRTGPAVCPENGTNAPIQCPSINNISFVGRFQSFGSPTIYNNVLQFSGNIAGIGLPIDRLGDVDYEVFDYSIYSPISGMPQSGIIMLANAFLNGTYIDTIVALSFGGATTIFPYRISTSSRSVVTNNAFYIISIGSCS